MKLFKKKDKINKDKIIYILLFVIGIMSLFNAFKLITINTKNITNTYKEEYDASELERQLNELKVENSSLKEELNALKVSVETNTNSINENKKNISSNNYSKDINSLKEFDKEIVNCLFEQRIPVEDPYVVRTNFNYSGRVFHFADGNRCKTILDMIS